MAIICGETIQKENVIAFLEVTGQRSTAAITGREGQAALLSLLSLSLDHVTYSFCLSRAPSLS